MEASLQGFAAHGYAVLPNALSSEDVAALNQAVDDERQLRPELWIARSTRRADNYYALLANPAFDRTIVNHHVLPAVKELMQGEFCFDEFLLIVRSPCQERPATPIFHRDTSHLPEHPLALRHLSVLYYLTDHHEGTHCWSVVPEDVARKRADPTDVDATGARPVCGRAGTAVLFNPSSCHAMVRRRTAAESRTIRVDFGHASRPAIGNDTIVPRRLLGSQSNGTQALFRRTNLITQLVRRRRP
jgi:ectoine hydroxylase-related dioxygenase (phytanoyl-CoA dioxygenase family)